MEHTRRVYEREGGCRRKLVILGSFGIFSGSYKNVAYIENKHPKSISLFLQLIFIKQLWLKTKINGKEKVWNKFWNLW